MMPTSANKFLYSILALQSDMDEHCWLRTQRLSGVFLMFVVYCISLNGLVYSLGEKCISEATGGEGLGPLGLLIPG
jgi:hypothetical protein